MKTPVTCQCNFTLLAPDMKALQAVLMLQSTLVFCVIYAVAYCVSFSPHVTCCVAVFCRHIQYTVLP